MFFYHQFPSTNTSASGQAAPADSSALSMIEQQLQQEQNDLDKLTARAQWIETVLAVIAAFATAFGVGEAIGKSLGIRKRRIEARRALGLEKPKTAQQKKQAAENLAAQ